MLSGLKRLFGGGATSRPAPVIPPVPGENQETEWTSFDMDPELSKFGSARDAIVVPSDIAVPAAPKTPPPEPAPAPRATEPLILLELLPDDEPEAPAAVPVGAERPSDNAVVAPVAAEPAAPVAGIETPAKATNEPASPAAAARVVESAPAPKAAPKRKPAAKNAAAKETGTQKLAAKGSAAPKRSRTDSTRKLISGATLTKGAWLLPGVDGWVGVATDNSVETVQLELAVGGRADAE